MYIAYATMLHPEDNEIKTTALVLYHTNARVNPDMERASNDFF